MHSHATTYHLTGTPRPPTAPEALPVAITILGAVVLVLLGAPVS